MGKEIKYKGSAEEKKVKKGKSEKASKVEQERKVKAVDKEKSKKAVEEKIRKESKNKTEKESKVKKAMKKKLNCERTKKAGGKTKKPTPKRTPQSVYAEHVAKLTAKTPKVSAGRKKHFEKLSKRVKKLKVVATEAKSEHKVKERQH